MTRTHEALYFGAVTHKRMRPLIHSLQYNVFAALFDCNHLIELDKRTRLFSYNKFNLVSLHDKDHGDGTPLKDYLQNIADHSGYGGRITRFSMMCYPRILGYAFNPLTVYFGIDGHENVVLVVYEVNNTFGERMTYAIPAKPDQNGIIAQQCDKQLYVSPFNNVDGTYSFRVTPLDKQFTLGVALKDDAGPLMKAYFRGEHYDFTSGNLLRALWRTGWMTVKVIAGIHLEAAKLWSKGLPPKARPAPPKATVAYIDLPEKSA